MQSPPLKLPAQLETDAAFQTVLKRVQEMNTGNEIGEAIDFRRMLQEQLDRNQIFALQPQLRTAYQQIIVYLKFITLHLLSEAEVTDLFQYHLLYGLSTDVDLKTKLELLFLSTFDDVLDMPMRRKVLFALTENAEMIGTQSLNIPELAGPTPPSIKFWIIDFLRIVSGGKNPTQLEVAVYFNQGTNLRVLNAANRDLLRQVISLYTYILNPSLSDYAKNWFKYTAYRQTQPPTRSTPVAAPAVVAATPAAVEEVYEDFRSALLRDLFEESSMEDAVYEEEKRMLASIGYETNQILTVLKESLQARNRTKFQAALFLLARSGELKVLLGQDGTLQHWMEKDVLPVLLPVLKGQHPALTFHSLIEDFRRQPNRTVYLRVFLEAALKQLIPGDEDQTAKVGVRLASFLFQEGYTQAAGIAFYDRDSHRFRWGNVGVDSQGVPMLL